MLEFRSEEVSKHVTRIYGFSTELMYLVEGEKKDILIDTGSGFGSLYLAVEDIRRKHKGLGKPLEVLITHGHLDHAMGAQEFLNAGCPVYLNHEDRCVFEKHAKDSFRMEGISMLQVDGLGIFVAEEDYIKSPSFDDFLDLKEGEKFDLGDVTIETFACTGHTKGCLTFLIQEHDGKNYLLTGDACNTFTFLFDEYTTSVEEYEKHVKSLIKKVNGRYDEVLLSHGNGVGYLGLMEDVVAVCEDIQNGKTADIPYEFMGTQGLIAKDFDFSDFANAKGNIVYDKNRIRI
ncbi:MBL fold metallo-hydrolase [Streptococcus rifensis]